MKINIKVPVLYNSECRRPWPTGEFMTYLKPFPFQFSDLEAFVLLIQMLLILTSKPPILEAQAETIK